jgi:elongator complex protein 5
MATTVITCKSFAHVLAAKAARERSLPEPTFGLLQSAEGVVQCLKANDVRGIVLETEFRRRSGRTESETYFLRPSHISDYNPALPGYTIGTLKREFVILLSQNPAYATPAVTGLVNTVADAKAAEETSDLVNSTFKLSLTEKEKAARNEVVLPYFDAQNTMGEAGEGGRILYDMGSEDDFDEEEDEI